MWPEYFLNFFQKSCTYGELSLTVQRRILIGAQELGTLSHVVESIHPGRANDQRRRQAIKVIFDRYTSRFETFSLLALHEVTEEYRTEHKHKPQLPAPAINPTGGTFPGEVSVTLQSLSNGAQIRYTTDGKDPTASSTLYRGPFTLKANATVKARAFGSGMQESEVRSARFEVVSPDMKRRHEEFQHWLARSGDFGRLLVEVAQAYREWVYTHRQALRGSNAKALLPSIDEQMPDVIGTFWKLVGEPTDRE